MSIWAGLGAKIASNGLQCGLLALLAFLPIGGLALLSPQQIESDGSIEFMLAALLLSRFLTPPVATLLVAYLARRDSRLPNDHSLGVAFKKCAFPSIGLVLAVYVFGLVASLFLVFPGVAFFLACCVVLPVLVMEGVSSPVAIKRSWELTKDKRWTLLGFFSSYLVLSGLVAGVLIWSTSSDLPLLAEPLPFVQTDAFLPLIFVGALLYSGLVVASYEIYTQLVPTEE
jgi:hypothetical protein